MNFEISQNITLRIFGKVITDIGNYLRNMKKKRED